MCVSGFTLHVKFDFKIHFPHVVYVELIKNIQHKIENQTKGYKLRISYFLEES